MNHLKAFVILGFYCLFFLASAPTRNYYQVYEAASDNVNREANFFEYEDDNCIVTYNLWEEGGNSGFTFYNKTDKIISLDKEKSFFILNGVAYDYFLKRTISRSKDINIGSAYTNTYNAGKYGRTTGYSSKTYGEGTAYTEKSIILIPPYSTKSVAEYKINKDLYRDCDLYLFPKSNDKAVVQFSKQNSPFVFSNFISYTLDKKENIIENNFYVKSISNVRSEEFESRVYENYCGKETSKVIKVNNVIAGNKFYIEYSPSKVKTSYGQKY
jgi:hypothetical protein